MSTKAAEAKEPHRYDEIRDEPGVSNQIINTYIQYMYGVL